VSFFTRFAKAETAIVVLLKFDEYHDELGRFTSGPSAASPKMTLTKIGEKKGSNPGGLYADALATKYYTKFYKDPNQGRTEALASSIFEMLGARTPGPKVAEVNGQEALITPWNDQLEQVGKAGLTNLNEKQRAQVAKMYMGAILTKNWDVVGAEHDNIVRDKKTGDMVEVDTGGSFKYRAQGSPKDYKGDIGEWDSLRDTKQPSGQVFTKLFNDDPAAEKAALSAVKSLDMKAVRSKFRASGLPDQAELFSAFKQRRDLLLKKGGF